jgi:hypothetical protein
MPKKTCYRCGESTPRMQTISEFTQPMVSGFDRMGKALVRELIQKYPEYLICRKCLNKFWSRIDNEVCYFISSSEVKPSPFK